MSKTPKIDAILKAKCPKCRRGDIFSTSMYGMKFQKTNEFCPHCNMKFEVEPGYFYVAMYVSYSLNVMEMLLIGLITYQITHSESPWLYIGIILIAIILLAPVNYRYSRVFLLHWLTPKVKYNPSYDQNDKI